MADAQEHSLSSDTFPSKAARPAPCGPRAMTPGSAEATAAGCTCPVIDNHHGQGVPTKDGPAFWTVPGCPLHGKVKGRISAFPSDRRTREMNAEPPAAERDMLKLKGMMP